MENIYNQSEFLRNSIVELPEGFSDKSGNTLYSWLGSLWRSIHLGDDMVRGLQKARGIRLAQLYLDILEAAKLQDRNGMPVFHRELWHPIVIRRSDRNKSQENMLNMGEGAEIGPQTSPDSIYGQGTVLQMGKLANYKDFVTYPIGDGIVSMSASIVDNIIKPTVVMRLDEGDGSGDFVFRNNSIIFRKDADPLAYGSPFEKYDVLGLDPEDPDQSDVEAVLWASEVLVDKNYISDHLSYPLGASAPSSDVVKRILNAAWSSIASGLTPELFKTFLAAMLNIPVIQEEKETVISIDDFEHGTLVTTDRHSYTVSPKAKLVKGLHSGSVMKRGSLLDESLRVYPLLNVPDVDTGFSVPLKQDIPSVVMPKSLLHAKTEYGIYSMWGEVPVRRSKTSPGTEDRPHLYFDVGGTESDKDAFWEDVWKRMDAAGVSMSDIFLGKGGKWSEDKEVKVSPAEFFLRNFVGANTLFVVVDASQLDDTSLLRNPMFFGMLTSVIPSAMRLFLVEHRPVGEYDKLNLDETNEDTFLSAALPTKVEHMYGESLPGLEGGGASFGDMVQMRFIRPAPGKRRVRKEEAV